MEIIDCRFNAFAVDRPASTGMALRKCQHKVNEHVDIDDIDRLKDIYKLTLVKILLG